MFRRVLWTLVLLGGIVGAVGCALAAVGSWVIAARVNHAVGGVLERVENVLGGLDRRITEVGQQIDSLKITTSGLVESLEHRAEEEVKKRLIDDLDIEQRLDPLSQGMAKVDHWIDVSESSIGAMDELVRVVDSTGVEVDRESIERLKEELKELRGEWNKARNLVEQTDALVEKFQAGDDASKGLLKDLLVRVIATVVPIEQQLGRLSERLEQAQGAVTETDVALERRIRGGAFVGLGMLVWLALGQAALCYFAWREVRKQR